MQRAPGTEEKPDQEVDPSVEVSQWLKDVGRRRWAPRVATVDPVAAPAPEGSGGTLRRSLLLALLLVVSLQYLYAFTTVEILSLPSLLVFVLAG